MCPIISLPVLLIIVAMALLIFALGRVSRIVRGMRHGTRGPRKCVRRRKDLD